ncbi:hypothetical protein M0R45_025843 [Rubus argutus]|uniref:Uncharacterized protein n=1 Tax=Rubus argutus TaxID=59490 RepID=A0AAW1WXD0_RUBAR
MAALTHRDITISSTAKPWLSSTYHPIPPFHHQTHTVTNLPHSNTTHLSRVHHSRRELQPLLPPANASSPTSASHHHLANPTQHLNCPITFSAHTISKSHNHIQPCFTTNTCTCKSQTITPNPNHHFITMAAHQITNPPSKSPRINPDAAL